MSSLMLGGASESASSASDVDQTDANFTSTQMQEPEAKFNFRQRNKQAQPKKEEESVKEYKKIPSLESRLRIPLSYSERFFLSIGTFDDSVLDGLQRCHHWILDSISLQFRAIVTDEGIFFLNILLIWLVGAPESGAAVSTIMGLGECVNALLKWWVQRARPFWVRRKMRNPAGGFEADFSFPSSHAQTIATIATCIILEFRPPVWVNWLLFALTLGSGLARIYLAVHYASDVIAGWSIGFVWSMFLHKLDILGWFAELEVSSRLSLMVIVPTVFYTSLWIVRYIHGRPSQKQVQQWEETAWANSPAAHRAGKRIYTHDFVSIQSTRTLQTRL